MGLRKHSILPGFSLTFGFFMLYLSLIVLIPLSTIFLKTAGMDWREFWAVTTSARVVAAYKLSFCTAAIAALINSVFGFLVAWVLVRYQFPGKKILDGLVDLPFALPTAVAGIVLTTLYAENGWIGRFFALTGIKAAFSPMGIVIALIFIGLPFVVRTVQPVLQSSEPETEEMAAILGADRLQTFRFVLLPSLLPSVVTGFALAFARGLGEYGSVIFISGNMPMQTEIAPLLIVTKLEQFDVPGATAIAVVMLSLSFIFLLIINLLQRWSSRYLVAT
ncbi:MAG TPA: sulfate ABC transporter permease subunit CysT [Dissulfurispiraceae bacterium]|nr:sulfate ABC transporter permease subunit CysT [Dissulfurispiraceae bacterium]